MMAAIAYKKAHIIDENGNKRLKLRYLVTLNNIITDDFNQKIKKYTFVQPIWYSEPVVICQQFDRVRDLVERFNIDIISQKDFINVFLDIDPFTYGNDLTCKVLFI